ncbi:MAG: fibronectin type III domain-containing protein [Spirochaetia bacterium]|nr:fibronectin type III domain-containing protein [Spirochaetia bacterium]
MKLIKKLLAVTSVSLSLLAVAGCSDGNYSDFKYTEDNGTEISYINLDIESVSLVGSKKKAEQSVTATVGPYFAGDTTVYWSSENTEVASVSASTGKTVNVILEGTGSTRVVVQNKSGSVKKYISVVCAMEITPPSGISNLSNEVHGNNVYFTWTDPEDVDDDLDHIEIKYGKKTVTVPIGREYGWARNLNTEESYSFEVYAVDTSGNKSSRKELELTTLALENPSTISGSGVSLSVSENNGTDVTVTWASPAVKTNYAYTGVKLYSTDKSAYIPEERIYNSNSLTSHSFENLSIGCEYTAQLFLYNEDFYYDEENVIEVEFLSAPSVTELNVKPYYSDGFRVTWKDYDDSSYTYEVTVEDKDGNPVKLTKEVKVASGVQQAIVSGLNPVTEYNVYVTTYDAQGAKCSSPYVTGKTQKVIWRLLSGYQSGYYVVQNLDASSGDSKLKTGWDVGAVSANVTYGYWLVTSALSGTEGYFSLQSCDADGNGSGYYMYLDTTGRAQCTGTNVWTDSSGYANKLQCAKLTEKYITEKRKDASFKLGESTVKTGAGWYRFYDENLGNYLCHASLVFGGEPASKAEDGAGCAAIYITETVITE